MSYHNGQVAQILVHQQSVLLQQRSLYLSAARKMNLQMREMLHMDFGTTLVQHCTRDIVGEVARRFFDLGDYYITVDQLMDRFLHFSYENDTDIFMTNEAMRKMVYNVTDSPLTGKTLREINQTIQNTQKKLFTEDRKTDKLDQDGKKAYRERQMTADGKLYDELTGREGETYTVMVNGKPQTRSTLHADHIQPRNAAQYNSRYLTSEKLDKLREFYNSDDNMQMIHGVANTSKGDICICLIDGQVQGVNARDISKLEANGHKIIDITYKASPEQIAEATIARWEKDTPSGEKIRKLQEEGYLDENGKVKKDVKEELINHIRASQNAESKCILEINDYKEISKEAVIKTVKSFKKILAGQVIYYVFPPVIFETQTLIKRRDITLDKFFSEIKKAGKRIARYAISKLREIFGNIVQNSIGKFVKAFFDIIIGLVKATVKKLVRIVKQVVISLINCVRVIANKNASPAEKADAVTKSLSVSISAVVLELLFEYLEVQFGLPDFLMEPLQIIVTLLSTNIIMLVLERIDLFNVRYGLMVSNIERIFDETNEQFQLESRQLLADKHADIALMMEEIHMQIEDIQDTLKSIDIYDVEVTPQLEKLGQMFDMDINFNDEWQIFMTVGRK